MFNQRGFILMVSLYDFIHRFGIPLLNLPRWVNTVTGMKQDLHPNIEISPFITHLAHERLYYTISAYAPYSLPTSVWVFLCPTVIRTVKELWDSTCGFLSLSEKTRMYNPL